MRWPVRTTTERFFDHVDSSGSCWLWTAANSRGYGLFHADTSAAGRMVQAHRWSYEHHVGPIPEGMQIDHLCRVTQCVNPDHLEPVTAAENNARKPTSPSCPAGHLFDDANTYRRKGRGGRKCRECNRIYVRAKRAAHHRKADAA